MVSGITYPTFGAFTAGNRFFTENQFNPITRHTDLPFRPYGSGVISDTSTYSNYVRRRLKLRGHGYAFQLAISSVAGKPFDIIGWSIPEQVNVGA
jgi:hypothetical protein